MKFLNLTNLIVSLCAASLYYETCIHLGLGDMDLREPLFVFGATFFIYNFNRLVFATKKETLPNEAHQWANRNWGWLLAFSIVGGAIVAYSFSWLKLDTIIYLSHLALLSLAYSIPVFGKSLRSIPVLKLLLIVYVWVVVSVVLPTIVHPVNYGPLFYHVLWERIFFIAMVAMAFNIRDTETDRAAGLMTIPVQLGERKASYLAYPLGLFAIAYSLMISPEYGITIAICDFCTVVLLAKSPRINREPWFSIGMDSLMLLRLGLLWVYFVL